MDVKHAQWRSVDLANGRATLSNCFARKREKIFFAFFADIWNPKRIFMTLYAELLMKVSVNHSILDKIKQLYYSI